MARRQSWFVLLLLIAALAVGVATATESEKEHIILNDDKVEDEASDTSKADASPAEKKPLVLEGLSEKETSDLLSQSKSQTFQAEVNRMMKLIINSLYKNRDIFLRELISNASDALDKIRFLSLTNKDVLGENHELAIRIRADEALRVLHIEDSGIGMTSEQLEKNLGTIARSGTAEFMEALQQGDSNSLIGQFGVGFYSSFLVADTVVVTSKSNDDDQYIWESDAASFKIMKDPRGEESKLARGTRISLYLKDEVKEFLKESTLRELVEKYSQFINFPIYLYTSKEVDVEAESGKDKEDDETLETEEEEKKKAEKVKEMVWSYEQLNTVKPIWTRSPKDISEEEYNEFFRTGLKQYDTAITHTHFDAEGEISFKALLYVPSFGGQRLLNEYNKAKAQVKLFVRRVFITDEVPEIMPRYLSFIVGLVDSDDLPLNVSRETLQQSKLTKLIRKKLVRKVLEMLKKLVEAGENVYRKFWKEFGTLLKLGILEDSANRVKVAKLLRFPSSAAPNMTSLDGYVERMKEGQDAIYFMPGLSVEETAASPLAESLAKKGFEILYFVDPLDEYVANYLQEFEGKKMVNVAKKDLKLKESDKEKKYIEREKKRFAVLTKWLPKALDKKIDTAVISNRLDKSPCVLVAQDWGVSGTMAKHLRAQGDRSQSYLMEMAPIMEINPRHPLVQKLLGIVSALPDNLRATDEEALDIANTLHDTAVLRSGYDLKDLVGFADRLERMLKKAAGLPLDAAVDPEPDYDALAEQEEEEEEDDRGDVEEIAIDDEVPKKEGDREEEKQSEFERVMEAIREGRDPDVGRDEL